MGMFKKLFGKASQQSAPGHAGADEDAWDDTYGLALPHPATPENMPLLADVAVRDAAQDEGVTLDYSIESLREVDRILIGYHTRGVVLGSILETVFCYGCYVGEVMRRQSGETWARSPRPELMGKLPVLRSAGGSVTAPIAKAFKCVQNGEEDSTYALALMSGSVSMPVGVGWEALGLPKEPKPETMAALAEHGVRVASEEYGVSLDYSSASVRDVDELIYRLRAANAEFDEVGGLVVCLGAYAGEVMIRVKGGAWVPPSSPIDDGYPAVRIAGIFVLTPIPRAIMCLNLGEAKSVYEYCRSMLESDA